jgi:hypothetical protein
MIIIITRYLKKLGHHNDQSLLYCLYEENIIGLSIYIIMKRLPHPLYYGKALYMVKGHYVCKEHT